MRIRGSLIWVPSIVLTVLQFTLPGAARAAEVSHIAFGEYQLPPFGFTKYCILNPQSCAKTSEIKQITFETARGDLERINREQNHTITPRPDPPDEPPWNDSATIGDCEDYAMTKRHRLLDLGYPRSALLLAVLWTPSQERHAVLIVKSNQGDFVLDNLEDEVVRWDSLPYQWMKISTPGDPQFWRAIIVRPQTAVSSASVGSSAGSKRCKQYSYLAYPNKPGSTGADRQSYFKECVAKDGNVPKPTRANL
jgi:predicted transglutaminase-like cysteine proteinase